MKTKEVRSRLWAIHCPIWRLAEVIGKSENTVARWLRYPTIDGERGDLVRSALEKLEAESEGREVST